MREGNGNLVAKVDEVFLSKQTGDHEVCGGGIRDIRSSRSTLGFGDKSHKRGQVSSEDESEYRSICRKKGDWDQIDQLRAFAKRDETYIEDSE